jgi:hypothetical protein
MIDNLQKSGLKVLIQGLDGATPREKLNGSSFMVLFKEKRGHNTI